MSYRNRADWQEARTRLLDESATDPDVRMHRSIVAAFDLYAIESVSAGDAGGRVA